MYGSADKRLSIKFNTIQIIGEPM